MTYCITRCSWFWSIDHVTKCRVPFISQLVTDSVFDSKFWCVNSFSHKKEGITTTISAWQIPSVPIWVGVNNCYFRPEMSTVKSNQRIEFPLLWIESMNQKKKTIAHLRCDAVRLKKEAAKGIINLNNGVGLMSRSFRNKRFLPRNWFCGHRSRIAASHNMFIFIPSNRHNNFKPNRKTRGTGSVGPFIILPIISENLSRSRVQVRPAKAVAVGT